MSVLHLVSLLSLLSIVGALEDEEASFVAVDLRLTTRTRSRLDPTDGASNSPFSAPPIAPQQFLMISSAAEKKIVWTTLANMESSDGRAFALVDSGLDEPKGLAFDHKTGHLYVADSGAKKIFRYTVLCDLSGSAPTLVTSGVRLTISQGHPVEYVTIDEHGNLFYTAPDTNNINKIKASVLRKLATGEFTASTMQIISEKTLEAQQIASANIARTKKKSNKTVDALPTDAPPVQPHILSVYEAKMNPNVSSPASIWADGADLYWTNQKDGKTAGTIVKGQTDPKPNVSKSGVAPFPAVAITHVANGAYGLAKSTQAFFFSRESDHPGSGLVTGLLMDTDITIDFVTTLAAPRGLVFDGDQTVYVADQVGGNVYSFPTGRMMTNVPLTRTVSMKGAFGLVILSSSDPAFKKNQVSTDGEIGSTNALATGVSVVAGANNPDGPTLASASFLERSDSSLSSFWNTIVR